MTKKEIKTFLIDAGFEFVERNQEFLYESYFFASFEVNNSIMFCALKAGQFTRWALIKEVDKTRLQNECSMFFSRINYFKEQCLLEEIKRDFE